MPSWRPPLNIGPPHIDPATADLLIMACIVVGIVGLAMFVSALWRRYSAT